MAGGEWLFPRKRRGKEFGRNALDYMKMFGISGSVGSSSR
jgi:hypothetical protein